MWTPLGDVPGGTWSGQAGTLREKVSESRDWQGGQLLTGAQSRAGGIRHVLMRVSFMKKMERKKKVHWNKGKLFFPIKGKTANTLGFAAHILSAATIFFHHWGMKKSHRQ